MLWFMGRKESGTTERLDWTGLEAPVHRLPGPAPVPMVTPAPLLPLWLCHPQVSPAGLCSMVPARRGLCHSASAFKFPPAARVYLCLPGFPWETWFLAGLPRGPELPLRTDAHSSPAPLSGQFGS